jgi:hypothetical protein
MYAVTLTTTSAFRDRSGCAASRSSSGSSGEISAPSVTEPKHPACLRCRRSQRLAGRSSGRLGDDVFASVAPDTSLETPLATTTEGDQ